jgi:hypothetical protein
VQDPGAVRRVEPGADVAGDVHDVCERQRPPGVDAGLHRRPGDELEREVVLAVGLSRVEHADEVAVLDRSRGPRLAQQAARVLGVACEAGLEDLERDDLAGLRVGGAEHPAHAALTEQGLDAIRPEDVADACHSRRG